jgi:signal transduction histidine kinase
MVMIERVLQNLMGNDLKFTPEKGKNAIYPLGLNNQTEVKIKTSGESILPECVSKIFDRYCKVANKAHA